MKHLPGKTVVPRKVRALVKAFCARYPRYGAPGGARGHCRYACRHLWAMLAAAGVGCHVVVCEHPKLPGCEYLLFHCVVISSDGLWVLDPTWRQFDKSGDRVRAMGLSDLQRDWLHYRMVPWADLLKGSSYRHLAPTGGDS
jgi:hypothetical protein